MGQPHLVRGRSDFSVKRKIGDTGENEGGALNESLECSLAEWMERGKERGEAGKT